MSSTRGNPGLRPIDIRDFGAVPGRDNAAVTWAAVQAAVDSLATPVPGRSRTIYFPGSSEPWCFDRPVNIDQSSVILKGDPDVGSNVEMAWTYNSSCFLLGIPRNAMGQTLSSRYFIDLYGKLDATAASAPGQRWGIRTHGDSHVAQGAGEFSFGMSNFRSCDYWGETRQLTAEFATDYSETPYSDILYFGMSERGRPHPFVLVGAGGRFAVYFRTQDGTPQGRVSSFAFVPPSGAGVHRIAFQIDLIDAVVSVFVDGVQVAIDGSGLASDFKPGSGLKFVPNLNMPFKINSVGPNANGFGTDFWDYARPLDLTLYGLRVSNTVRYATDGVGRPQRRIDGRTINDSNTYFESDANTVGLFTFQDDPATAAASRYLTVQGLTGRSVALFLSANHATPFTAQGGHKFKDLLINCSNETFGQALTLGYVLYLDCRDCTFTGGAHGIGSWNWGANYVSRIQDCTLYGTDAAIYNFYGMMELENIFIPGHGRSTIWMNSTLLRGKNIFCSYPGAPEYLVRGQSGSAIALENFQVDIEDNNGPYPSKGAFYAESTNESGSTEGGRLILKDVIMGTLGRDTPVVTLHQTTSLDAPALFALENLVLVGDEYKALVQTDGQSWRGEIKTVLDANIPPVLNLGLSVPAVPSGDLGGGIVSRHDRMVGPPRSTRWFRGAHALDVPSPADGQYARWRCVSSGMYGTETPPRWQGLEPMDAGVNGLAAYVLGHTCWSAGPGSQFGYYTDGVQANVLNRIFTGTDAGAPAGLYLGLSTIAPDRVGHMQECTGAGYARAPLASPGAAPAFTTSAGGMATSTRAATFPTATADWAGIRSLFLIDTPSGAGNVIAVIGLDPMTVAEGSTLSYDAGALKVISTLTGGCLAGATWDAFHNLYLGGKPISASTLYLALSIEAANPSAPPAEPAGNGYARVAAPATSWTSATTNIYFHLYQRGTLANSVPLAFPTPVGPWPTVRSVYLMDAPSGGNVIAAADLTIPRSPTTGGPAPTFAAGALWVSLC